MLFKRGDIVYHDHYEFPFIGQVVKTTKVKSLWKARINGTHRVKVKRILFVDREPLNSWHYMNATERIYWNKELTMVKPNITKNNPKFKAQNKKKMEIRTIKCH